MIIRVYFEKTDKVISFNNQHQMNGFIYALLGDKADKYHDSYSRYSVSSIQGGHISPDKKGIVFDGEPYIQISSNDLEIIGDFVNGILNAINNHSANFFGLYPTRFDNSEFHCNKSFDVVKTISPILIRKDGNKLNCKDADWVEVLEKNCKDKLSHEGIDDKTFRIEVKKPERLRTKMIWVGGVFNPCTEGVFTIYGKKETREKLLSLGLGNSTGSGFGAMKILTNESCL